jgi:fructokinase
MILCCGEALIDMLPITVEGEPAFRPLPGGSVFNTSIALGRLGTSASFFSGLSDDLFGTTLQKTLRESNVDLSHAAISMRPTTLAFVKLESGHATYFFYDENTAGRMLSATDLPKLGDDVQALLFGGISLVSEPCGTTYESLMRREAESRVIMLDPNIRPGFIQNADAHRARLKRMFALTDIVKVSGDDLAWIDPQEPQQAVAAILAAGVKLVVLTDGERGASAYWNGGQIEVPALAVEIVDTVGAGDTFNAGILAALHESGALNKQSLAAPSPDLIVKALTFAAKAAAVTVSRAGANPPWRHELTA